MKAVNPNQLVLTEESPTAESSERIDPGRPTFKSEMGKVDALATAEAAREQLGRNDDDEFDWNADDSVILREQRATAAYRNKAGELIIRQRAGWNDDSDTFVFISPENEVTFMEGLAKKARE